MVLRGRVPQLLTSCHGSILLPKLATQAENSQQKRKTTHTPSTAPVRASPRLPGFGLRSPVETGGAAGVAAKRGFYFSPVGSFLVTWEHTALKVEKGASTLKIGTRGRGERRRVPGYLLLLFFFLFIEGVRGTLERTFFHWGRRARGKLERIFFFFCGGGGIEGSLKGKPKSRSILEGPLVVLGLEGEAKRRTELSSLEGELVP